VRWVTEQAPEKVAPREPGAGKLKALEDAPGTYVRVKA
jgi:polyhydroxyalkanoate synthase